MRAGSEARRKKSGRADKGHSLIRFALALAVSLVIALLRVIRNCGCHRNCDVCSDIICLGQVGGQRLARPSISFVFVQSPPCAMTCVQTGRVQAPNCRLAPMWCPSGAFHVFSEWCLKRPLINLETVFCSAPYFTFLHNCAMILR